MRAHAILAGVWLIAGCGAGHEPTLVGTEISENSVPRRSAEQLADEPRQESHVQRARTGQPAFEPEPAVLEPAEPAEPTDPFYHDEPEDDPEPIPPGSRASPLPQPGSLDVDGRALATMEPERCLARVTELALPVQAAAHPAVDAGLRPQGPIGGVSLEFGGRRRLHEIMDCRLLLAIHAWAPLLRRIGVRKIRHLSALRPGAIVRTTGRPSGHSRGLAFDPRFFEFDDGRVFDVLEDWDDRTRGAALCEPKNESPESAQIRLAVCAAIEAGLFQVVVSPHHNDDHQNHLHLEVVPHAGWNWSG